MTETTNKLRAVFLTALMIGSVFAAGIAFTGTAAADHEDAVTFSDQSTQGSEVTVNVNVSDTNNRSLNITDQDGTELANESVSEDGNVTVTLNPSISSTQDLTANLVNTTDGSEVVSDTATITYDDGTAPQLLDATSYTETGGDTILELAFSESVSDDGDASIMLDGEEVTDFSTDGGTEGRVVVNTDAAVSGSEVTVSGFVDDTDNSMSETTLDVTVAPVTLDTNDNATQEAYAGTNVAIEGAQGDSFEFDGEDISRTRGTGTGSQVYVLDTDDLSTGDINVSNGDVTSTLTLDELGLSASADAGSFATDSNVTVTASADDINRQVSAVLVDSNGDETDYTASGQIGSDGSVSLDLGQVANTGNYTVAVTDVNSGVTAQSETFEVVQAAEVETDFAGESPQTELGDIATVNVSLTATDTATVVIGDEADAGYQANITVTDENGDGYVEFNVNTYLMGSGNQDSTFYIPASDESGDNIDVGYESGLSGVIADGSYDMTVRSGSDATENADTIGQFYLDPGANINGQTVWTAPGTYDIDAVVSDATITEDDTIATGDYAVHQFDASGFYGVIENHEGETATDQFLNAVEDGNVSLSIAQTEATVGMNADAKSIAVEDALNNGTAQVVTDSENNTFYVVTDAAALPTTGDDTSIAAGDAYNATFSLNTNTGLVAENTSVSAEYSLVEPETTLDYEGDEMQLAASSDEQIAGQTSLADGTTVNVRVQSEETPGDGFIVEADELVVEDGQFNGTVDLSEAAVNSTFTVEVTNAETGDDLTSVSGVVVEDTGEDNGTDTATDTATDDGTDTATDTATDDGTTADNGGETTADPGTDTTEDPGEGETDGSTPGFGIAVALIAVLGAALLALRE